MKNLIKPSLKDLDLQRRLKKWSEVTALSLNLLDASLRKEFPEASERDLRIKVIERLNTFRHIKLSKG